MPNRLPFSASLGLSPCGSLPRGRCAPCVVPSSRLRLTEQDSSGLPYAGRLRFAGLPAPRPCARALALGLGQWSVPFGGLWPPLSTYAQDATLLRGRSRDHMRAMGATKGTNGPGPPANWVREHPGTTTFQRLRNLRRKSKRNQIYRLGMFYESPSSSTFAGVRDPL